MAAAAEHLARETELADRLGQPGLLWYAYYHTSLLALVEGRIEGRGSAGTSARRRRARR